MRIFLAHNYYLQSGGEDNVFHAERELLRKKGHEVIDYEVNNKFDRLLDKITIPIQTIWSLSSYFKIRTILREERIEIAHFHNTFFRISPSAYYACHSLGIPVVQTLHNYRLACPAAIFYREGKVCEDCLGNKTPYHAIRYRCYRNSFSQTVGLITMLAFHNLVQTWQHKVDIFITLSRFAKKKFIAAGLPVQKIAVKPNFLLDVGKVRKNSGKYVLFVGRLNHEKGLLTLLNVWEGLKDIPLKIAGVGKLQATVEKKAEQFSNIEYIGFLEKKQVIALLSQACFVVFPSECYETFGLVVIEAYSVGIPVISSNIGAVCELVKDGETGLLFKKGDALDLKEKIKWLWNHPAENVRMSKNARREYVKKYTPEKNYQMLMDIYDQALVNSNKSCQ